MGNSYIKEQGIVKITKIWRNVSSYVEVKDVNIKLDLLHLAAIQFYEVIKHEQSIQQAYSEFGLQFLDLKSVRDKILVCADDLDSSVIDRFVEVLLSKESTAYLLRNYSLYSEEKFNTDQCNSEMSKAQSGYLGITTGD